MAGFVIYPNAVLRAAAAPRAVDAAMLAVGEILRAAAHEVQAYGLAAAHIGLPEPVVVLSVSGPTVARDYSILYNPEVILAASEVAVGAEGSVSMPGIEVPVERPVWAEIAFDTADGTRETVRLEEFVARVALHEIDQMNGVFFLDRVSRMKRDMAIRKFDKSQRYSR